MKNIITLVLLFPFSTIFSQDTKKIVIKSRDEGTTETFYVLKSDESVKHGSYRFTSPYKETLVEGYYNQGQKDSVWTEYWGDGKTKKVSGMYADDKQVGIWEYYFKDGSLAQQYDHTEKKLLFDAMIEREKDKEFIVMIGTDTMMTKLDHGPLYIGTKNSVSAHVKIPDSMQPLPLGIPGTVVIQFVIDKNGKAIHHQVIKSVGYGYDELALRLFKTMPEKWIPGQLKGQPVDVLMTEAIDFKGQHVFKSVTVSGN